MEITEHIDAPHPPHAGPPPAFRVPGDESGFAALIERHQAMVYSLAYHGLRNRADAEELAQDVFLALYQNREAIQSHDHLVFWLRRVTSRRCIDRWRRFRPSELLPPDVAAVDDRPADPWVTRRLRILIRSLLQPARMILVLRYQEDLDPDEIARVLGMRPNTVKSHLRRSLAHLRRKWPQSRPEEIRARSGEPRC